MNVELKRIADKKLAQLGGDVCGVLVRKDGKLAAVDEYGRVQWLRKAKEAEEAEAKGRVLMDMCRDLKARVTELEKDNAHQRERRNAARDCINKMNGPWLLRKQAEAVDEVNRKLTEISEGMDGRGMDAVLVMQYAASTAGEEARRLRQQADEAEQAGGEK